MFQGIPLKISISTFWWNLESAVNRKWQPEILFTAIYSVKKVQWLNSDKDMNIEYNDVKNIAAAEFAISRDIAMIDIQMHSQSND